MGSISDMIASRVDSDKDWRPPGKANAARALSAGNVRCNGFQVSRLGMPVASPDGSDREGNVGDSESSSTNKLRYIHIPRHAWRDFYIFAKGATGMHQTRPRPRTRM